MKAVMMYETGGPEVLKYEDVATPQPGAACASTRGVPQSTK